MPSPIKLVCHAFGTTAPSDELPSRDDEIMAREIILAYRHLYKHGLRAVQYSQPARWTLRNRLREKFRTGTNSEFNQKKIDNTIEFLKGAARERGLEHRIVKRLLHVWHFQPWYLQNRWHVYPGSQRSRAQQRSVLTPSIALFPNSHEQRL
jgi:hypothetical protein